MRAFHHSHRHHEGSDAFADVVIWALIAGVALVNVILMWRIATGSI
jgi:hypothetical protein